jgi:regulator of Ty1 transposition protein 109
MAVPGMVDAKSATLLPTFLQQLASVLPKGIDLKIHHISTPPTRASAIYSAPPGTRPDRTYCESHFLTGSIRTPSKANASELLDVLVFAIEVLIYSTAHDTTFFVSKADSTGFLHLLQLPKGASSPLREISGTFLRHLVQQRHRPNIRSIVSLFARAQDQYLFPGSVEYHGKHILDDRGLVRWWCRVLNPLTDETQPKVSQCESVKGYLIVPGLDTHETLSYIPRASRSQWTIGHPLRQISRHSSDVPPRCLVPHFPDDPKSRYLDELDDEITKGQDNSSGQWRSVKTIDQFWEMMAFRQECSAGRLVGFIWIIFTPSNTYLPTESATGNSQSTTITLDTELRDINSSPPSSESNSPISPSISFNASSQTYPTRPSPKTNVHDPTLASQKAVPVPRTPLKKKLTGAIITRQPRIKTQNKNYLLDRPESTAYYVWNPEGRGQVIVDESDYKRVTELLLRLDFESLEKAISSSSRWINEVRSGAIGDMRGAWGQIVSGTKVFEPPFVVSDAGVNTLNTGMVRKKRKADVEKSNAPPSTPLTDAPSINVLASSMIRKKPKVV